MYYNNYVTQQATNTTIKYYIVFILYVYMYDSGVFSYF